jgi:hypothetical protein
MGSLDQARTADPQPQGFVARAGFDLREERVLEGQVGQRIGGRADDDLERAGRYLVTPQASMTGP